MEQTTYYIAGDLGVTAGFAYDYQQALEAEGLKPLYKVVEKEFWNGETSRDYLPTAIRFVSDEWLASHPTYYGKPVERY